jgi:glutamate N-acetyltransferase/amino-acid N-acetyltransferase
VPLDPARVALHFDEVCVFRNGLPVEDEETEARATRVMKQQEIRVRLDLGLGDARFTAYTCDLSYDYVKINAAYRS